MSGRLSVEDAATVSDLVRCLIDAHEFFLLEGHEEFPGLLGCHPDHCVECAAIRDGLLMVGDRVGWATFERRFPARVSVLGGNLEVLW